MTQAGAMTMAHDALLPRAPGGNGPGAVLALLVHAGLVAALTVSVDWRAQAPDVVSAELWASVPQASAPPAPEAAPQPAPAPPPVAAAPAPAPAPAPKPAPAPPKPAPPPAEPDIATQRAERRKAEVERRKVEAEAETERKRVAADKKRAEDEKVKREQSAQAAKEARAQEERLAQQREENLRRMMSQAGGVNGGTGPATSTGTAAQSAAPSAAYTGRLVALIRGNLVFTGSTPDNNAAEVEVNTIPSGAIISKRLHKSSGHKDWDEAVLRAIDKTEKLPRDVDGRVPSRLVITFRPRE